MKYLLIGLTLIFAIAKLFGLISWSWWLVLLPAIIYLAVELVIVIIAIIIGVKS